MKEILYNHNQLNEYEINEIVTRTKALIINSKQEILLGYCSKTYQFPGGHLEENESLLDCFNREITEETGLMLNVQNIEPFMLVRYYNKDYPKKGINRCSEVYFYVVKTDVSYDLQRTNYDKGEKEGNYTLYYIPLEEIERVLTNSIPDNPKNIVIVPEMLEVIKEYQRREEDGK